MTALAPALNTGLQLTLTVTSNGTVIDTDRIAEVEIWHAANRIPRARITLFDGQADTGRFPFSESEDFLPGNTFELSAGYGSDSAMLHKGLIVGQSLTVTAGQPARLAIESADMLLKMTLSRNSLVSEQTSDADLISTLVSAAGGSVGTNAAATTQHESFVQAHASDWDLMLLRAEANGCVAIVEDGKVDIVSPTASSDPVLSLVYGESIISLDLSLDAVDQLSSGAIATSAWSYTDQKVTKVTPSSAEVDVPGNVSSATLAEVFGVETAAQRTGATLPEAELTDWATGALVRRRLAQVRGTAEFQGNALIKPGKRVTLDGLGARFNGDAFVSGVRHRIADGDWRTTIDIGMAPHGFATSEPAIADIAAAGLVPPLRGLQTGKVLKVATDPAGNHRVQVTLPLFDAENAVWARLGQFYASKGVGAVFFPEKDDEVVLGFMNEDPSNAVILGSLYSSTLAPAYPADEKNTTKALVTRSKMEINFNDEDRILKISTPGERIVTLDDKSGTLSIVDPNKHSITMTASGVEIVSAGSLSMTSKTDMTIAAGTSLTMSAKTACDISGGTVSATGKSDLKLASNAMGSLKTAAVLEINGALVKIN